MAGKNTFLAGRHPTRDAEWVPTLSISKDQRAALSDAVGRELNKDEFAQIADMASYLASFQATQATIPTSPDIRRTLRAIERMADDDSAAVAASECDEFTAAMIGTYRRRGASWRDSAKMALAAFSGQPKGRPASRMAPLFVLCALDLWEAVGGDRSAPAWTWDDVMPPLVQFAHTVAAVAQWDIAPSYLAESIRRQKVGFSRVTRYR